VTFERATESIAIESRRGHIDLEVLRGRPPRNDAEVALGSKAMHRLDAGIGDVVVATAARGPVEFRVVGQAVFPPLGGELRLADAALFTVPGLQRAAPDVEDDVQYVVGRTDEATARAHGFDTSRPRSVELDQLADVERLPIVLSTFLGAVGIVALVHVLFSSLRARRLDLAVLRAIGMTPRDNRAVLHWHGFMAVGLGVAIGVPLGIAVGGLTWRFEAHRLGIAADVMLPVVAIVGVLLGAYLVALVCTSLPASRAARLRPSEILRSE
jgi:putative ABC transport system permease protein